MVTKADLEQVPVSEQVVVGEPRGRSGLRIYSGNIVEEFQRELRGINAIRIYDEMRRSEPVIAALMEAITTVMQGVAMEVHAGTSAKASTDPIDIAAKEFVSKSWAKLESEELMENICTMFAFGWALFEPVYKYEEGKIWWDRLAFRGQDTLYSWEWDDEAGRVTAFLQRPAPSFKEIRIPADRFLLFRTASEKGNPEGRSLLRAAYKPYHYKRTIEEIEAIGAERDLVGIPVMNVPYNATNTEVEEARQIVERISIDEQVGVAMTATGPAPEDRFDLKILSGQGSSQKIGSLERVIERYSTEMTMVALAQFLRVGQGNTGSYNLSSDQRDLFQVALRGWLRKIVRVLNSQAIPRLLAMNGMRGQCHFVPGRVSQLNLQVIANFLTSGVQNGWISPDANLEQFLRREAELPPPEPGAKPAAPPADAKDNSGLTTNPGDNQNGGSFGAAKAGGKIEGAADAKTPEEKAADAENAQKALDSLKTTEPEQFGNPHHDSKGRFAHAAGGGNSDTGAAFAEMESKSGPKWRKDNQARYDSDPEFRAAVDGLTLFTQGSYTAIRNGSVSALAGKDLSLFGGNSISPRTTGDSLDFARNPMADYKTYMAGQDVRNLNGTTRESGRAIQRAIAGSPAVDAPLYRGAQLSRHHRVVPKAESEASWREKKPAKWKNSSGDKSDFEHFSSLKGKSIDIFGATSFTADADVARAFSTRSTKAQGKGGLGHGETAIVYKVLPGAKAIPVSALSPYKQKEYVSSGKFKVLDVEQETVYSPGSRNLGPQKNTLLTVTLQQTDVWMVE